MPAIKYKVELTPSQRSDLIEVSRRGKPLARTVKRALAWTLRNSSGVGKGIDKSVVQGGRDFPYIRVGGGQ